METTTKPPGSPHVITPVDELALLVDAVRDYAIIMLGPTGIIRSWNPGAERIIGYDVTEVLGRHFSILYTDEDIVEETPRRELETAAAEGRVENEGWRIRKDGTHFWANTVITALVSPAGELRGYAKITRDLTERREAEEQLRRNEEMFRLLVGSVKDYAIFMLDPNGRVTTWNAGARRIKGYEPGEIIGRHFSTFYPEEDIRNGKPERELAIAREQGSVEDEGWRLRKDGTRFWANVVITAVYDKTGTLRGFAKVTRDITERKQAEDLQRELYEQREARLQAEQEQRRAESSYRVAQEANRAKDEFLMTLSHELRTPMTAILGWARMLPNMVPGEEMFREAIAAIARGAQLQARLIDDVLDVSRIVSGKMRLVREQIDVGRVVESSTEAVQPTADAKQVTIQTDIAPGLGLITADATRLQQVIWNLLTNALKFTPKGGTVRVNARRTSSQVQITVTDTGEGIEPDFLPHIFEPFRQAENPRTRIHGGLGLGLSIVRYIVEAHGGTVSAESQGRGKGTTFTVTIPIGAIVPAVDPRPGGMLYRPFPELQPDRLANLRILLIDDDRGSRELIAAVLRQSGAAVTKVASAEEALAALEGERPDLVISDIAMPDMDGFAFLREIRGRDDLRDLKVIALTAFPAGAATGEARDFDAYLSKPIDPGDLVEAIAAEAKRNPSRAQR